MPKAKTQIQYGSVDDKGKVTQKTYAAGDDVKKGDFSDDEWQGLVDAGAIEGQGPFAAYDNASATDPDNPADGAGKPSISEAAGAPRLPAPSGAGSTVEPAARDVEAPLTDAARAQGAGPQTGTTRKS